MAINNEAELRRLARRADERDEKMLKALAAIEYRLTAIHQSVEAIGDNLASQQQHTIIINTAALDELQAITEELS